MKSIVLTLISSILFSNPVFAEGPLQFQPQTPNAFQLEIMQREADLRGLEEELNTEYWRAGASVTAVALMTAWNFIGFRKPLPRGLAGFRERFIAKSKFQKVVTGLAALGTAGTVYLSAAEIIEVRERIALARAHLKFARETVDGLMSREIPAATDKCTVDQFMKSNIRQPN